ncbi:hypothetical protein RPB_3875 [Rhodopseudomonas palustris HaA2]|uniref:Uncharacterized protein n=1 Tax=Rhodopseudomonas palustris (strain HaA2) TaxID=316058 RepID=Q2IT92_RHOP2|nr:hypothetical protein RPB_3875 [Rhodopseudomonas palustris HaA2]
MRIDPLGRNVVARAQHTDENAPRRDLRLGGGPGHVRIIAGELDPDRIVAGDPTVGRLVVDVLVVVAVGAVAMGGDDGFRHRPIHRAVGLDPERHAAPGRGLRLFARAVAGRSGRAFGLVHDDVAPRRLATIAPRRQPDHAEAGNLRRARALRDLRQIRRKRLRRGLVQRQHRRGQQRRSDQAMDHRWTPCERPRNDQAILRTGSRNGGSGSSFGSWIA